MDGRSVWPDDFDAARRGLAGADDGRTLRITPSTSLSFLPYTVEGEDLPAALQFARQKAQTLASWAAALAGGPEPQAKPVPHIAWPAVGDLTERAPRAERRSAQSDAGPARLPDHDHRLAAADGGGPPPAFAAVARAISTQAGYESAIGKLITDSIAWQERMGLDVLVHGEFERTDMVEYFAAADGRLLHHASMAGSSPTGADAPDRRSSPRPPASRRR